MISSSPEQEITHGYQFAAEAANQPPADSSEANWQKRNLGVGYAGH